jgi:hypothetical protein
MHNILKPVFSILLYFLTFSSDSFHPPPSPPSLAVRAPISHRSDGSAIADNAMSDANSILHVLCRLSVSPHYNVQKAALYGFRELVACQVALSEMLVSIGPRAIINRHLVKNHQHSGPSLSDNLRKQCFSHTSTYVCISYVRVSYAQSPLLLRFVALEPLCLVAMLHVLTCRQHVKLQREALQLMCFVIEQASKVPVAQVNLLSEMRNNNCPLRVIAMSFSNRKGHSLSNRVSSRFRPWFTGTKFRKNTVFQLIKTPICVICTHIFHPCAVYAALCLDRLLPDRRLIGQRLVRRSLQVPLAARRVAAAGAGA